MLASSISTCNNIEKGLQIKLGGIEMEPPRGAWGVMAVLLMIRIRVKGSSLWGAMYHFGQGTNGSIFPTSGIDIGRLTW